MKIKMSSVAAMVLLITFTSYSQTTVEVRDLESWSAIGFSKKMNDQTRISLEQQFRFYNNSSKIDQLFTEFSIRRKTFQYKEEGYFYFTGGLRYIADRDKDDNSYDHHIRLNGDLGYKHEIKRFAFDYRIRLQTKNELGYSRSEGDYLRNKFRLKAGMDYNIRNWKFDPEVSAELFRTSGRYEVNQFEKFRITVGTKYSFKNLGDLSLFYRLERELQGVSYPKTTNIIGVKMMFKLKPKER